MFRFVAAALPHGVRTRLCSLGSSSVWHSSPSFSSSAIVFRAFSSSSKLRYGAGDDEDNNYEDDDIFARYREEDDDDDQDDSMIDYDDLDDEAKARKARRDYRIQQTRLNEQLDRRTGRAWEDPYRITDEEWSNRNISYSNMPDWSPDLVSRVSQERVNVYEKGIPTLEEMAIMPLPPPDTHPADSRKLYIKDRHKQHAVYVAEHVVALAEPSVKSIVSMARSGKGNNGPALQDATDEMFESIESKLRDHPDMDILSKNPNFSKWVEQAIEDYLLTVQEELIELAVQEQKRKQGNGEKAASNDAAEKGTTAEQLELKDVSLEIRDRTAEPIFMDCFQKEHPGDMVPPILHPLKSHHNHGPGRMVEEWELSAHDSTKRIMLRQCIRTVAQTLVQKELSRIYVHGREGVGKSATLASIVAMARKSGHIVLYMPDGDRLRKHGYYIQPNPNREGMFDLNILSQEVCGEFMATHCSFIEGVVIDSKTIDNNFTLKQLRFVERDEDGSMTLVNLLKHAAARSRDAAPCFIILIEYLMNQDKKPFLVVMDQFNCYFDAGQYFHGSYDPRVIKPIPLQKITLFEPFLSAMGIYAEEDDDDLPEPVMMKRGGIVVATTEHHSVPRAITKRLTACAERQEGVTVVEVPRYSHLESDHILANFEATGVGKLRLDRGETIMNKQEVEYLKSMSGCVGQQLLEVSIAP